MSNEMYASVDFISFCEDCVKEGEVGSSFLHELSIVATKKSPNKVLFIIIIISYHLVIDWT